MSMTKTFAAAEVADFIVRDYLTKELLFTCEYASEVKITGDASDFEITGGIGNPTLMTFYHSKKSEFSAKLPLVSMDGLGVKLGKKVTNGATRTPKSETLTVSATHTVELSQTPITGTLSVNVLKDTRDVGQVLSVGDSSTLATAYSITGKVLTLHSSIAQDSKIIVAYEYTSGANTDKVTFTAKDMPSLIEIFATTNIEDEAGNTCPVAMKVYKTKVSPKFEMTFKSGAATEIDFSCKNLADASADGSPFFDLITLGDEDPKTV
jgi:hypothetical protein